MNLEDFESSVLIYRYCFSAGGIITYTHTEHIETLVRARTTSKAEGSL